LRDAGLFFWGKNTGVIGQMIKTVLKLENPKIKNIVLKTYHCTLGIEVSKEVPASTFRKEVRFSF
jgi:hypothetical protein